MYLSSELIFPWTKLSPVRRRHIQYIFINENIFIFIRISLKFVLRVQLTISLAQVMAWHQSGDKPLPEPKLTQFIDAYMRHKGEMS